MFIKKMTLFFIITTLIFLNHYNSNAQIYLGAGPIEIAPMSDWTDYNDLTTGFSIQVESRKYCKWWFGIHVDLANLTKSKDLDIYDETYFNSLLLFSPSLRYNFFGDNCYEHNLMPYAQVTAIFSSIDNKYNNESNFGIGGSLGGGIAYGFHLLDICWMVDLNAQYSMPNILYKSNDNLIDFQSLNIAIILSIQI